MSAEEYPRIVVEGGDHERGEQYGALARDRIHESIASYREVFRRLAGLDWTAVCEHARVYADATGHHQPRMMDELRGIARGADLSVEEVVAINARTEFIIGARVLQGVSAVAAPGECSAVAVTAPATAEGVTAIGQNWDYLAHTSQTVIVLETRRDDGPNFVTIVEAGLLAKIGMNSCGVALVTNGLATCRDVDVPGLPYHVLLRRVLDSASISEAVDALRKLPKASSANYLIASADDCVVNVEAWGGNDGRVSVLTPDRGVLVHTNHFLTVPAVAAAVPFELAATSVTRRNRVLALLADAHGAITVEDVKRSLSDHANHPLGVCTHEDLSVPEVERYPTIASLLMVPQSRRMLLADGNPCSAKYRPVDCAALE